MPSRKKKKTEDKVGASETKQTIKSKIPNDQVSLFTLAVVVIIILGVIGIVFGYAKDKIAELKKGGLGNSAVLEEQIKTLKTELQNLSERAKLLEQENEENKELVAGLFDQKRKLPDDVDTEGWSVYNNEIANLKLSFPASWEVANADKLPLKEGEAESGEHYIIKMQPKEKTDFVNAIILKDDYRDFSNLSLDEKYAIFKELDLLDEKDFSFGKMLYFIDLDENDNEIPTILILTDDRILRVTFNVYNKNVQGYITFRTDFEKIISKLELLAPAEALNEETPDSAE